MLLLDPTADTSVELNENVLITLLGGSGYTVSGTNGAATSTIANDDTASITIGDVSIVEGNSGTKTLTFTITLDKNVDSGFSLNYATANGTAIAGSDYVTSSGTLSFTGVAGESKTVSVTIYGDATVELDEAFELVLSGIAAAGRNVTFARSRATGTIANDDQLLAVPTALQATDHRSDGVIITWLASPNATSYEVWRNTTNVLPASALATGIATASYTDSTAQAGVTYYYWVRAVNASAASGFSGPATGYVLPTLTLTTSQTAVLEDASDRSCLCFHPQWQHRISAQCELRCRRHGRPWKRLYRFGTGHDFEWCGSRHVRGRKLDRCPTHAWHDRCDCGAR